MIFFSGHNTTAAAALFVFIWLQLGSNPRRIYIGLICEPLENKSTDGVLPSKSS